ncbi:hypothetical protein C8F04DRAFT_1234332 [Mycena alexandri]|uniref:Uncharacterized protein n=1 Tax=Mycena alexandri TaxID=1745969 RepID=A0AAD6X3I6_9AGAR|nr:hypothetical protein C8F04DRAFT_1234332 [Mycena alexandri]
MGSTKQGRGGAAAAAMRDSNGGGRQYRQEGSNGEVKDTSMGIGAGLETAGSGGKGRTGSLTGIVVERILASARVSAALGRVNGGRGDMSWVSGQNFEQLPMREVRVDKGVCGDAWASSEKSYCWLGWGSQEERIGQNSPEKSEWGRALHGIDPPALSVFGWQRSSVPIFKMYRLFTWRR